MIIQMFKIKYLVLLTLLIIPLNCLKIRYKGIIIIVYVMVVYTFISDMLCFKVKIFNI